MKEQPIEVRFAGKEGNHFLIKFPNLKIPVTVNENLFQKMKHSKDYVFKNLGDFNSKINSA